MEDIIKTMGEINMRLYGINPYAESEKMSQEDFDEDRTKREADAFIDRELSYYEDR